LPEKPAVRSTNDWPCWRGPLGTGIAEPGQKVPLKWSATENVVRGAVKAVRKSTGL